MKKHMNLSISALLVVFAMLIAIFTGCQQVPDIPKDVTIADAAPQGVADDIAAVKEVAEDNAKDTDAPQSPSSESPMTAPIPNDKLSRVDGESDASCQNHASCDDSNCEKAPPSGEDVDSNNDNCNNSLPDCLNGALDELLPEDFDLESLLPDGSLGCGGECGANAEIVIPSLPNGGDKAPESTPPVGDDEALPPSEDPLPPTEESRGDIPSSETSSSVSAYEREVVALVNEIRRSYGLNELKLNEELSAVAREKSDDMRRNGYFDHVSPTYGSPFDMMKAFGISYRAAGENIAMGYPTPAEVVDGWMNSEGHRANILNTSFTEIGVGYIADGHYWTQMFIG